MSEQEKQGSKPPKKKPETLDEIILRMVGACEPGKSVDPSAVAKAFRSDNWQGMMREVRLRAIYLAKTGQIAIYRKGKPADPDTFKGVYRLGLPQD
ncbi:DUF3253 domain-containing protein [Henriciella litoralis]|uniref:DUF3253 domain-containing protein n=1 Tax=Henriciella litoralis TaxID=568102 RepID=UPI001F2F0E0C|nr:DUF3253 domain-containing protein [Henriciella litoralis]